MRRGTDTQTDARDQFSRRLRLTRNVTVYAFLSRRKVVTSEAAE